MEGWEGERGKGCGRAWLQGGESSVQPSHPLPPSQSLWRLDLFFVCGVIGGFFLLVVSIFMGLTVSSYPWLVPLLVLASPSFIPSFALGCLLASFELRWMPRIIAGKRVALTVRRQYTYIYGLEASFAAFAVSTPFFLLLFPWGPIAPSSSLSILIPLAVVVFMGLCTAMAFLPVAALTAISVWARMKGCRLLWRLIPGESRFKDVAEIVPFAEQGEEPRWE